jgi:hypothetical protein
MLGNGESFARRFRRLPKTNAKNGARAARRSLFTPRFFVSRCACVTIEVEISVQSIKEKSLDLR